MSARPLDGWKVTQGRDVAHWFRAAPRFDESRGVWPIYPLCGNTGNPRTWSDAPQAELGLTWRMCRVCHQRLQPHLDARSRSQAADELIRATGCQPPIEASP